MSSQGLLFLNSRTSEKDWSFRHAKLLLLFHPPLPTVPCSVQCDGQVYPPAAGTHDKKKGGARDISLGPSPSLLALLPPKGASVEEGGGGERLRPRAVQSRPLPLPPSLSPLLFFPFLACYLLSFSAVTAANKKDRATSVGSASERRFSQAWSEKSPPPFTVMAG